MNRFFRLLLIFLYSFATLQAQSTKFSLVIDPGHGGHDPGAIGKFAREKDINLAVALQLGEMIATNYADVKVTFTRNSDKYLTLQERADIVNSRHADLFISIHTNSAQSSSASGTESFTLGLAKSKGNLDVAMRENAVMLLEDDYKSKYKGFDPTSVDSYIMFEFMQDKYIDRSVAFASDIQTYFKNYAERGDRGVRQAGFWVLYRSACPSVLVELGFVSNPAEEKYLASSSGQKQLAESIYKAFVNFKYEYDKKAGKVTKKNNFSETESLKIDDVGRYDKSNTTEKAPLKSVVANTKEAVVPIKDIVKPPLEETPSKELVSDKKKNTASSKIDLPKTSETDIVTQALSGGETEQVVEKKQTKHIVEKTQTKQVAAEDKKTKPAKAQVNSEEIKPAVKNQEVETVVQPAKSSTISADKQKYVDLNAYQAVTERPVYKIQLFASSKKLNSNSTEFRGIRNTDFYIENGMYKYTVGADTKYEVITKLRKELLSIFPEAFIIAFLGKNKIPVNEAIKLTNKNK